MLIKIDDRENNERIENAINYFEEQRDTVKITHLDIGDYIVDNQVVFEYKTLKDFINSVKTRRVFNQAIDQSLNFKYHFVVVVSTENERKEYFDELLYNDWDRGYFNEDQYIGSIARINTFSTVIQAECEEQAFRYMRAQARKCLDNKQIIKRLKTKTDNPAFNYLSLIKNVGDETAELIVDNLELYSLDDLLNITNNDLQAIHGIGSRKAGIVMRAIKGKQI